MVFGSLSVIVFSLFESGIISLVPEDKQKYLVFTTYEFNGAEVPFAHSDFFITEYFNVFTSYTAHADWRVLFYIAMLVIYTALFMLLSVIINKKS